MAPYSLTLSETGYFSQQTTTHRSNRRACRLAKGGPLSVLVRSGPPSRSIPTDPLHPGKLRHKWSSTRPRQVEIERDQPLRQHHCSRCGRDFVESLSGERWAVYVSIFSFRRLPNQISTQWVGEVCSGAQMPFDNEVRSKPIDHQ